MSHNDRPFTIKEDSVQGLLEEFILLKRNTGDALWARYEAIKKERARLAETTEDTVTGVRRPVAYHRAIFSNEDTTSDNHHHSPPARQYPSYRQQPISHSIPPSYDTLTSSHVAASPSPIKREGSNGGTIYSQPSRCTPHRATTAIPEARGNVFEAIAAAHERHQQSYVASVRTSSNMPWSSHPVPDREKPKGMEVIDIDLSDQEHTTQQLAPTEVRRNEVPVSSTTKKHGPVMAKWLNMNPPPSLYSSAAVVMPSNPLSTTSILDGHKSNSNPPLSSFKEARRADKKLLRSTSSSSSSSSAVDTPPRSATDAMPKSLYEDVPAPNPGDEPSEQQMRAVSEALVHLVAQLSGGDPTVPLNLNGLGPLGLAPNPLTGASSTAPTTAERSTPRSSTAMSDKAPRPKLSTPKGPPPPTKAPAPPPPPSTTPVAEGEESSTSLAPSEPSTGPPLNQDAQPQMMRAAEQPNAIPTSAASVVPSSPSEAPSPKSAPPPPPVKLPPPPPPIKGIPTVSSVAVAESNLTAETVSISQPPSANSSQLASPSAPAPKGLPPPPAKQPPKQPASTFVGSQAELSVPVTGPVAPKGLPPPPSKKAPPPPVSRNHDQENVEAAEPASSASSGPPAPKGLPPPPSKQPPKQLASADTALSHPSMTGPVVPKGLPPPPAKKAPPPPAVTEPTVATEPVSTSTTSGPPAPKGLPPPPSKKVPPPPPPGKGPPAPSPAPSAPAATLLDTALEAKNALEVKPVTPAEANPAAANHKTEHWQQLAQQALASGVWAAKQDPKTGKTYFVNKATRKSTWNLEKELYTESINK